MVDEFEASYQQGYNDAQLLADVMELGLKKQIRMLEAKNKLLEKALKGVMVWAEYIAGDTKDEAQSQEEIQSVEFANNILQDNGD